MYYEKRKNNSFAMFLILVFLMIIICTLIVLIREIEDKLFVQKDIEATGVDKTYIESNIQNIVKNSSYSIVRSIEN